MFTRCCRLITAPTSALALLVLLGLMPLHGAALDTAPPGTPVVVLAPPWQSGGAAALVARAGGTVLPGHTGAAHALASDPDFVARLYHHGAWIVLDAAMPGLVCASPPQPVRGQP
ncbi:MAG: hypothetical protein AAGI34_06865 [Pseudomonadota bacterium]